MKRQWYAQVDRRVQGYLGASIMKDLSNMCADRSTYCSRNMVLRCSDVVSNNPWPSLKTFNLTCNVVSSSVSGAGLTRVMSWAAADVMSSPADCMAGCMRGASDSKVKVDSGEGKLNELAVTTASICSTDDCMMLARVFNSTNASCEVLRRRALSITFSVDGVLATYLAVEGWMVDIAGCGDKGVGSGTDKDIVDG